MLNTRMTPPAAPKQVLLRLPEDLATKLARAVPPRGRNQFLVDLISHALTARQEEDKRLLIEAAQRMNALEAQFPELARETEEWVNADLTGSVDVWDPDFDREAFEQDRLAAKAKVQSSSRVSAGASNKKGPV